MKEKKLSNREFGERFDKVASIFDDISNPYTLHRRYNEIEPFIQGDCLEVGVGTGSIISNSNNKKTYTLSDISFNMCDISKQKYKCNTVCCDAEELPFSDNSFDTIISSEMIYILNRPENFINEAYRVLKKNGVLIITAANQDMVIIDKIRSMLRLIGFKGMYFNDGVRRYITSREITKLLSKHKFKIKTQKKIIFFPFKHMHFLNLMIEKTFLNYFCIFIFVVGNKI